jgi:hydroxyacylglutathione hydrolase
VTFERRRYFADNYVYVLASGADVALVDPGDAQVALSLCGELGVEPRWVLHTHGHGDHSGGSREVASRTGATVIGHRADASWYEPDEDIGGRAELRLGALHLRVHAVPGHTPGSVLLEWEGRLLTGDTLFWGGCGNCRHGGDPRQLARSFDRVLSHLDGALEVHPGHDYALANLPFTVELDPQSGAARARLEHVAAARRQGREPEPSKLREERETNLFLRPASVAAELRERGLVGASPTEEQCFLALRGLRDGWRAPPE